MTLSGRAHIQTLATALPLLDTDRLQAWGHHLADRLPAGGRLLVAGNGGSAAEAQHLTSELVGRYRAEREPLSAIALHADSSSVTAIANDYGTDELFARQVRAHGRPGDILLLLSTSGTSPNVLAAARAGRELGLIVWALTGPGLNPLADLSDQAVCVDAEHVATVQECHLVAVHVLCAALDAHLTAPATAPADEEPTDERRLVVVGDVLLDRDITGTADQLSPEAPVPVISDTDTLDRPGGAGLAAVLAAREPGWHITLVCGIGQDAAGARLRGLLHQAGIEVIDLATSGTTAVKTRVRAADRTLLRYDTAATTSPNSCRCWTPSHRSGAYPALIKVATTDLRYESTRRWGTAVNSTEFEQWRLSADAEDARQEMPQPTSDLCGIVRGSEELLNAVELLQDLSVPGALARARGKISWALTRIPQEGPDESCHRYRWHSSLSGYGQMDVCSKMSCGRCAPLMEVRATHEEPDGGRCEGCGRTWVPEDDYAPYLGGFVVHTKDCPVLLARK